MQARNRIWHYLLTLLILISLLVACQGGEGEKPTSPSVTITFACPEYHESTYRDLADRFEATNPDVRVQVEALAPRSDLNQIVTQADTLLMPAFSPTLMRPGFLRDLTPFIESDKNLRVEDYYPVVRESLERDGGIWGLPADVNFHLIFYDKEAFDDAGVPYPEPGWTWEDLLTKAQALTEREGEEVTRWGFAWRGDPLPFVHGRAGALLDTSVEPAVPLLDRPEVAESVRWLTDLALTHQVMPVEVYGPVNFLTPTTAMWIASTRNWPNQSSKVGMAPMPVDEPDSTTTPISVRPYVMSAGTAHPEESWRWLAFLSRQITTDGIPPARSASDYWENLDQEVAATYRFALEHGFSLVETAWVEPALSSAVEAVLQGEQTVEEALAGAQTAALTYIESELDAATAEGSFAVPTPVPSDSREAEVITFLATRTYHRKKDVYEALAERFHEVHPELTVEIEQPEFPPETSEVTLEYIAAQGDCLETFAEFLGADDSALISLDPFIEAEATFPLDDFYPSFLEPFRRQGRLWALPVEGYPRVMYYNQELFDAADLTYPSQDWTLDDLVILAEALTSGGKGQYGYLLHPDPFTEPIFFVEQQGARLVNDSGGRVAYTLDTPVMAKAVRWYVDLARRYGVTLNLEDANNPEASLQHYKLRLGLIRDGKAAMWSMYPLEASNIWKRELNWGATSMPRGPGQVNDLTLVGYSISARSEYPQACWEWFKFLLEQPDLVQGVPARRSIAESEEYRQGVDANLADAYFSMMEQDDWTLISTKQLRTRRDSFVLGQFRQALEAALNGEDVEQALGEAQHTVDEYLLCLETTTGYDDEGELIDVCAAQAEQSRP
jgi:multiple sugar transport system substrate-binding protein